MANRTFSPPAGNYTTGVVRLDFSFTANGASDPATTTFRGEGVASVVHSATGKYTVTLSDGFRYVISAMATLEDTGSGDGAAATVGTISNEGSSSAISLLVFTNAADGTKTDYSSRRVSLQLALKNSSVGK